MGISVTVRFAIKGTILAVAATSSLHGAQAQSQSDRTAVKAFEQVVAKCRKYLDAENKPSVYLAEGAKSWAKSLGHSLEIDFDIRRTESLVSTHTGKLSATWVLFAKTAPSREDAARLTFDDDDPATVERFSVDYIYSKGRWRATRGANHPLYRFRKGESFAPGSTSFSYTAPELKESKVKGCV